MPFTGLDRKQRTALSLSIICMVINYLSNNAYATTIAVTETDNDIYHESAENSSCSLRQAILASNLDAPVGGCPSGSGLDTIAFHMSKVGPTTIVLESALPTITDPVVIDGLSLIGCGAKPCVEIKGSDKHKGNGLLITAGDSTVRGLIVNGFDSNGIVIKGRGNNVIEGNYIGIDATGTGTGGSCNIGIHIENSPNNLIGGSTTADRNVISGCYVNIYIEGEESTGNVVSGNYIGTDPTGSFTLSHGTSIVGVGISNASHNTIGGVATGEGNLISGHRYPFVAPAGTWGWSGAGIWLGGTDNRVVGNLIGTNSDGLAAIWNGTFGLYIEGQHNIVGGSEPGAGNVISGNGSKKYSFGKPYYIGAGITAEGTGDHVIQGNIIGADVSGTKALGNLNIGVEIKSPQNVLIGGAGKYSPNIIAFNRGHGVQVRKDYDQNAAPYGVRILGNAIFANGGIGIDLRSPEPFVDFENGLSLNDPMDTDEGPNHMQNSPVLASAILQSEDLHITGTLESTPLTDFIIDLYVNDDEDPSGYGEGQTYVGQTEVSTNHLGYNEFYLTLAAPVPTPGFITATATAPDGSTSEFSRAQTVIVPGTINHPRQARPKTPLRAGRNTSARSSSRRAVEDASQRLH